MRLISTIEYYAVVSKIFRHLGLYTEMPEPHPAGPPPEDTGVPWEQLLCCPPTPTRCVAVLLCPGEQA